MTKEQVNEDTGEVVDATVVEPQPEGALISRAPEDATIVRVAPGDVIEAMQEYQKVQSALDAALPDCHMQIRNKLFRKKSYWRAVATAFNLSCEMQHEEERVLGDDWGWIVTYRAVAPNGRSASGDGSCFASEKQRNTDTVHNVRSHAHSRAFNRAISNLVGFGEVSAEEVERDERPRGATPRRQPEPAAPAREWATDAQKKMLSATAYAHAKDMLAELSTTGLKPKYDTEDALRPSILKRACEQLGIKYHAVKTQIPFGSVDPMVAAIRRVGWSAPNSKGFCETEIPDVKV